MAQTAKKRAQRVYSMQSSGRETLWESLKLEEKLQAMLQSPAGMGLRKGLPVFAVCVFAAQGRLAGGAMPFACALMAGVMMRGSSVGYAAAGCMLGALIGKSPAMLLACALLCILYACLRSAKLRPNDLTCVISAGLASYLMPLLFAQDAYDHLMAAAGSFAAMVLARMYATALRLNLRDRELLSAEELISLTLLFAGVATGFRELNILGSSPVNAAFMLLSMSAGYLGGAGLGSAVGAIMGLMLGVTQPAQPQLLGGMVLIGLLSGVFSRMGRLWVAAAVPVAAILAGAMDVRFFTWARAAEIVLAIIGYLCIRELHWDRLRIFVDREAQVRRAAEMTQGDLRGEMQERLREYASLYGRMARTVPGGAGGQFSAVGTALERMADDLSCKIRPVPELSREIAQALDREGVRAEDVQAQKVGDRLRVCAHIACRRHDGLCDARVTQTIAQAAGVPLRVRPTGVCPKEGLCALQLEEAWRYDVSVGCASAVPDEHQPCGDTLTTVQLPDGQYMLALADGMGHGADAQEESRAAVDLMEDFLLARFEPEAALHGVNDLMLGHGDGERFSTMDLSLIDLTSGTLRAMKIGAVSSYIRRGHRVIELTGDALPMGIVEKVKPSVTQLQMQDGDVLVLLSDGVTDAVGGDEAWLQTEIQGIDARAPEASARRIIEDARAVGRHMDDMTVCILRLVKRRKDA